MYGNEQAQYTMNRAAYGDVAASMMMGGNTIYGGAYHGINNMLSDIGGMVMPVGYMPPARVNVGFYGQYRQKTGFFSSGAGVMGLGNPGRSQMASDYMYNSGSDFGERLGGGLVGAGAATAAMGMGSVMGSMLGGGIIGSLAGGLVGSAAAGIVMDSVGQRREINNFLEQTSFRTFSPGGASSDARRGGLNMAARRDMTDFMRQQDFKDPFMSTEDLTMILQQGTQRGMFAGTQNMDDFKKKFKELTDSVKVVTRTLGQTLEEAMGTIKELKSIGVDPSQAKSVVSSADAFGRMAGRTGAEMLNIGLQGAELFRGTGVNMGIGAQATMMNLATVRAARDAGTISSETVAQAGGEEALAMRMNASGLAFAQSQVGRGFGAAFFNQGMGMAGFNQGQFMAQMMNGGMNLPGLAMGAAGNLSSPAALISYQANQEKFMTEAGKTFGGRGLQMMQLHTASAQADYLAGATGAKFEDALRLSMKQQGMSNPEIEAAIGEARGAGDIYQKANNAAGATYQRSATEEAFRANTFYMLGSRIRDVGKSVVDSVAQPIERVIDDVKSSAIRFTEEQVGGVRSYNVGDIGLSRDLGGSRRMRRVTSIDQGGLLGGVTAGEALAGALKDPAVAAMLGVKTRETSTLADGEVYIDGRTAVNVEKAAAAARSWNFSADDVKRAQEKGALDKVEGGTLTQMLANGIKGNDIQSIAMAAYGKTELSRDEAMKLYQSVKGTALEGAVSGMMAAAGKADNAMRAVDAETMIQAEKTYRKAGGDLRDSMRLAVGVGDSEKLSDDAIQLVAAAANAKDPAEKKRLTVEAQAAIMKSSPSITDKEAMAAVAAGMKNTGAAGDLAAAQGAIREKQQAIGASNLGRQLVSQAKSSDMGSDDIRKVEDVAYRLANVKTADEFMAVADASASTLKNTGGGASAAILKTRDVLRKIETGDIDKVSELDKAASGLGIKIDDTMRDSLRSASQGGPGSGTAKKALQEKILELVKSSNTTSSGLSAGAGGSLESGANAAAAFDQQMNINQQILQSLTVISQKLGAR